MILKEVKFIDLFAGIGGTRLGFEHACIEKKIKPKCVFTSEIKPYAIEVYKSNFGDEVINGDITQINIKNIPKFDYLLAGFPCQPFSSAGNRHGFLDKRGGLFSTIVDILREKQPIGFLLENVDGLVSHAKGETLKIIISELEKLEYNVSWKVLNSADFGVPQKRLRVYIVGHKKYTPVLDGFTSRRCVTGNFIDEDYEIKTSEFTEMLLSKFNREELYGKSIKDKRGGENNIHSWNLGLKGDVTVEQSNLLDAILIKRRHKKWAEAKGIDWMDGMPLTLSEIKTFYNYPKLEQDLAYLTEIGYLRFEHPKKRILINGLYKRVPKIETPKGYNIVSGKLSFPISYIIDPNDVCPTIVATEAGKIAVSTKLGVRSITIKEGLLFSGFPDWYKINGISYNKAFDLIGNTVMPPVIKDVSIKLLEGLK